jgi:hypothetical protein
MLLKNSLSLLVTGKGLAQDLMLEIEGGSGKYNTY